MNAFLTQGNAALLILVIVALEGIALWRHHQPATLKVAMRWLSPTLAGAALVLSIYIIQKGFNPQLLGAMLILAGAAHVAGLGARWSKH